MSIFTADPSAIRKVTFDWADYLTSLGDGTTISTSEFSVSPDGPTLASATNDTTTATVTITFGASTKGKRYRLSNKITTSTSETDERSCMFSVIER